MSFVALAVTLASAVSSTTAVHRSAVIIGVNDAFESSQPTLQYADDDAARWYEMFAPSFDRVELLTVLDDESQDIFGDAAKVARPPNLTTLEQTLDRMERSAVEARDSGRRTELFFVYVGHGRVAGGEGEVKLLGGALTRTQLTALVLERATHDRTHLIIDACNAYHLVNARGAEQARVTADFDDAFEDFVDAQDVTRFPSVGVVLSTSGAGTTLEWSRLLGGVFSYEVRSALTGAADADENGAVDYTEVEAFLASANIEVPVKKGRPKVYVRAPRIERSAPLLELSDRVPSLELPPELDGHYVLEDDRGVRYAELHKAVGYRVALRLVPRAGYALLTKDGGELWRVDAPTGVVRPPMPLGEAVRPSLPRGGEAPPGMFAMPYGPEFLVGFLANDRLTATTPAPAPPPTFSPLLKWSTVGAAVVLGGLATWQAVDAGATFDRYNAAFDAVEKSNLEASVRTKRRWATGLGVASGVLLSAGVGMFVFDL
ncbi:MAG: hypothetical protein RIT81_01840 [Deltaproteobacteria bacterium]